MEILTCDVDREVGAPGEAVRTAVHEALRDLHFAVDCCQGSYLEAHVATALTRDMTRRMPVRAQISVISDDTTSRLHVHLGEAEPFMVNPDAAESAYATTFAATVARIDQALGALDPRMGDAVPPAVTVHRERLPAASQAATIAQRLTQHGPARSFTPARVVELHADAADVAVPMADIDLWLAIAALVTADTTVPPRLLEKFDKLARKVRDALRTPASHVSLHVDANERTLFDFVWRQVHIRRALPLREIHRCRDCGQVKITNPEYGQLMSRGKALQSTIGAATSTMMYGPAGAVSAATRLLGARAATPSFACPRCQGTTAQKSLGTICPKCKTIRTEAVLTRCDHQGCGYRFDELAGKGSSWEARTATQSSVTASSGVSPPPLEVPPATPAARRRATAQGSKPVPGTTPHAGIPRIPGLKPRPGLAVPTNPKPRAGGNTSPAQTPASPPALAGGNGRSRPPLQAGGPRGARGPIHQGWFPDPLGRCPWRWFDRYWTNWASDGRRVWVDAPAPPPTTRRPQGR